MTPAPGNEAVTNSRRSQELQEEESRHGDTRRSGPRLLQLSPPLGDTGSFAFSGAAVAGMCRVRRDNISRVTLAGVTV